MLDNLINNGNSLLKKLLLVVTLSGAISFSYAQHHIMKNTVYIEVLGAGEFYSLNIDHVINELHHKATNVRGGFAITPGDEIYLTPGISYMHDLRKHKNRFVEMGFGAAMAYKYTKNSRINDPNPFRTYAYLELAYRKQGISKDPIFWKVAFTPLLLRLEDKKTVIGTSNVSWLGYFLPSFGASIGYSFEN